MALVAAKNAYAQSQTLVFQHIKKTIANLEQFLLLAADLNLSVTQCSAQFVDQSILENLVEQLGHPTSGPINPALLIRGGNLEEQVSLAAHHILRAGFDVRLIRDLVLEVSPRYSHIHDHRLVQAGVVPIMLISLHQSSPLALNHPISRLEAVCCKRP